MTQLFWLSEEQVDGIRPLFPKERGGKRVDAPAAHGPHKTLYSRCRRLPMALPGQMLHAVELGLNHPLTQERIVCRAELPPCFQILLRRLRSAADCCP